MIVSKIRRLLIGSPIATDKQHHQLIPKWKALAVLSSDALSSTAYATEEIIIPLSLSGILLATAWSIPVALGILALMIILCRIAKPLLLIRMVAELTLLQKKILEKVQALLRQQL